MAEPTLAAEGLNSPGLAAKLGPWAQLTRISNLPTCLSNVLVGTALGGATVAASWAPMLAVTAAVMLLYAGGMALNDVLDAPRDRRLRPQRPIPAGRISAGAARRFAILALTLGMLITTLIGQAAALTALALVGAIVIYNLVHHRFAAAAVLMGACRGLVYVLAATAVTWPLDTGRLVLFAAPMTLYVTALTLIARQEHRAGLGAIRWWAVLMPAMVLPPAWFLHPRELWWIAAGIILLAWLIRAARCVLRRPPATIAAVLSWLAGISLIDAYFLTLLQRPAWALAAAACFALTVWSHRRVLGT